MSLSQMKISDLRNLAEQFGVDLTPKMTKEEILVEFEESGITWNYIKKLEEVKDQNQIDEEDSPQISNKKAILEADGHYSSSQLLKLTGKNSSIEVLGYKFSQTHPFNLMDSKNAQEIIDFFPDKFRLASPREAEDFYA